MASLKGYITTFVNDNILPLGVTAIFVTLVLIGFAFLGPGHKLKEWGKEHILWLIIGAAILYTAADWASSIAANFGF